MSKKQLIASAVVLVIAVVIAFLVKNAGIRIVTMCIAAGLISTITRKVDV